MRGRLRLNALIEINAALFSGRAGGQGANALGR